MNAYFTKWRVKMVRQIILNGWERLIDPSYNDKNLRTGTDQKLFSLQAVFMSTVLDKVLINTQGMKLVLLNKDSPRTLWDKHEGILIWTI